MEAATASHQQFDETLTDLLVTLEKVIEVWEEHNLNLSHDNTNSVKLRLESYINTYDKTSPEDHIWSFENIYNKHKSSIMKGPSKDNWITKGNIIIQFGEDVGIKNNIKIHLSSIYNTSCKLRDDVEESLEGLPDVEQTDELLLPVKIQYYLYRIFSEIITKKTDRKKLMNFVGDLGLDAGIKNRSSGNGGSNPLDGLMETMSGMAKQMGIPIPEGQNLPSGNELSKIMGQMVNNPQTKSLIGNVMKEMKDCDNIGDMAGKLVGALGAGSNPELKSMVENVGKAVDGSNNDGGEQE